MNRLTKKIKYPKYMNDYEQLCNFDYHIINKLGRLEDLEEQLGCPLEVMFKALAEEIWYEGNKGCLYHMRGNGLKFLNGWCITNELHYANTKDYKKTWWLKKDKSE